MMPCVIVAMNVKYHSRKPHKKANPFIKGKI